MTMSQIPEEIVAIGEGTSDVEDPAVLGRANGCAD